METIDVVIIGTGIFGLATARTYCEAHPEANVVILEAADSLGGTWATHRLYPGLKTNNILGTYEFPDFPMLSHKFGVAPWQHIPGTNLHNYLVKFAEHFGLTPRVRFNTKVEVVEQGDDDTWILTLQEKGAASVKVKTSKLVVATGMTGNPNLPAIPGAAEFEAPIFHAKDFLQHSDLLDTAKNVVVYGGAKSAWDAVYAYASSGVSVDWVIRESGKGPCWMASPFATPLRIWIEKLVFMRVLTWMTPCIWGAKDGYETVKNFLHTTVLGRWIVSSFFGGIANDTLVINNFDAHPETAKLKPWSDAFWGGTSLSMLNYPTDFFEHLRSGLVKVHHADITHLTSRTAHLSTGETLTADALHCSTGWKHEAPIKVSPESLLPELGLPHLASAAPSQSAIKADEEILERFPMLKDQPDLFPKSKSKRLPVDEGLSVTPYRLFRFMVPPKYIHKRNFVVAGAMLSLGQPISAQVQGLWITSYLDGTLNVPESVDEVDHSAELFSRYGKLRTPAGCGSKHGDMIFEAMPYWDQLLQDLGLPFKRKPTWLQEIFMPYGVGDYAGLVQEWIQLKKAGKLTGGCGTALLDGKMGNGSTNYAVNGHSEKKEIARI
ncbi:hypothetical protein EDB80DRAFT_834684 [Ilyonectria destructans]|nr:hypothetical protein EDB80DRAFT_834684 [Ilyonectria destructans]